MVSEYVRFVSPSMLEIERVLPASRERVWEYLINPDLRKQWFCAGDTGNAPGAPFVMDFDHTRLSATSPPPGMDCGDPVMVQGKILIFDPPSELAYEWPGASENDVSVVNILLTAEGEKTRLRLIHSKLVNPEFQKGASAGWHAHLDLLVDLVQGKAARDFWLRYGELQIEYESRVDRVNRVV